MNPNPLLSNIVMLTKKAKELVGCDPGFSLEQGLAKLEDGTPGKDYARKRI